ncbi:MAG: FtsX-like permease family protein [Candidatus Babeliales bacterium]
MDSFIITLAYRYIKGAQEEKNISLMTQICFWSILIGSVALVLVTAVMNGFEKATQEKFQAIHPEIFMQSHGKKLNIETINNILHNEFPEIHATAARAGQSLILADPNDTKAQTIMSIKAIDPINEPSVSNLAETIVQDDQKQPLTQLLQGTKILIGQKLADQMGFALGDTVNLLYMSKQPTTRKVRFSQQEAQISGFFKSGISDFDTSLIITSLDFFKQLFPDEGIKQLGIKLKSDAPKELTIQRMNSRFGLDTFAWQQLYPALLQALKLEKWAMFFILALITLVASMNIISLLFMVITQKQGNIAILKSMGMANHSLTKVFMLMGISIAFCAALVGLALGFAIGLFLTWYPLIQLPDVYYVSHLPIHMEPGIFIAVLIVVLAMSSIATLIATGKTKSINIARVLRAEG